LNPVPLGLSATFTTAPFKPQNLSIHRKHFNATFTGNNLAKVTSKDTNGRPLSDPEFGNVLFLFRKLTANTPPTGWTVRIESFLSGNKLFHTIYMILSRPGVF
jgi:hypothetical protein